MIGGKAGCAVSNYEHVLAVHDQPREGDDVGDVANGGHGAHVQIRALHKGGVQLNEAVAVEERSSPRIKGFVVFHMAHGLFDGVFRRVAGAQESQTDFGGPATALAMRRT